MPLIAALAAILMWSSLATLTVSLSGIPPLYLTGMSLFIGGALSIPWMRHWSFDWRALAMGTYGQFTYHVLYIVALRSAPPVNANLVHYAWPLLILIMSPLTGKGLRLGWIHILAAIAAFTGVILATSDGVELSLRWHSGYGFALAAAFVWASYSVAEARNKSSSPVDVGPACMVSGLLALAAHAIVKPSVSLDRSQWALVMALGIGPTGCAFYLWSLAMRHGDARIISVLSNATPILSTLMLVVTGGRTLTPPLLWATLLVTCSSLTAFMAGKITAKVSPQKRILPAVASP